MPADLLLSVSADLTQLEAQLARLGQLGGAAGLQQILSRATVEARQTGQAVQQVTTSLNAANQAAVQAAAAVARIGTEERARAADMYRETRAFNAALVADRQRDITLIKQREAATSSAFLAERQQMQERDAAAARAINQLRQLEQFQSRLAGGAVPSPTGVASQPQAVDAARRQLESGLALTGAQFAALRTNMDQVTRAAREQVGWWNQFEGAIPRVLQWVGLSVAAFGALRFAMTLGREAVELDRQLTLIAATMESGADRSATLRASYDLISRGMKMFGLTAKESGELVFELSKVLNNSAELMSAAYGPALTLTSLKETDRAETIRVLVGLYNLYGDSIEGAATETQKFTAISDVLLAASFASVASVQDFTLALGFVGSTAKQSGFTLEQTVALLAVLSNNLTRASRSGTGLANVLQQLGPRFGEIAQLFAIPVDLDHPNPLDLLLKIMEKVRAEGPGSIDMLQKLQQVFPDIRGERIVRTLTESLDQYWAMLEKTRASAGATARVQGELATSLTSAAGALRAEVVDQAERFFAAMYGTDPAKMEGSASALRTINWLIKTIGDSATESVGSLRTFMEWAGILFKEDITPEDRARFLGAAREYVWPSALPPPVPEMMLRSGLERSPLEAASGLFSLTRPGMAGMPSAGGLSAAGLSLGVSPMVATSMSALQFETRLRDVMARLEREQALSSREAPFEVRIQAGLQELAEAEAKLVRAEATARAVRGQPDAFEKLPEALRAVEEAGRRVRQVQKQIHDIRADETRTYVEQIAKEMRLDEEAANNRITLERDIQRQTLALHGTEEERARQAATDEWVMSVAKATSGIYKNNQDLDAALTALWLNYKAKLAGIDADVFLKRQQDVARGLELTDALLGGSAAKEYQAQKELLDTMLRRLEEFYDEDGLLHARYLAAKAELEAAYAEKQAAEDVALIERRIAIRARGQQKLLAYLQDPKNFEMEARAADIQSDQVIMERKLRSIEIVNRAQEVAAQAQLRRIQEEARAQGDLATFLAVSFARAAGVGTSAWEDLERLTADTARAMSTSFSDLFFNVFTGQVTSAEELFKGFLTSMARAISDFLAQQVVKTFAQLLLGMGGGGAGLAEEAAALGLGGVGTAGGGGTGLASLAGLGAFAGLLGGGLTAYGGISGRPGCLGDRWSDLPRNEPLRPLQRQRASVRQWCVQPRRRWRWIGLTRRAHRWRRRHRCCAYAHRRPAEQPPAHGRRPVDQCRRHGRRALRRSDWGRRGRCGGRRCCGGGGRRGGHGSAGRRVSSHAIHRRGRPRGDVDLQLRGDEPELGAVERRPAHRDEPPREAVGLGDAPPRAVPVLRRPDRRLHRRALRVLLRGAGHPPRRPRGSRAQPDARAGRQLSAARRERHEP